MPYIIKKYDTGFKVCKLNDEKKCFSKEPIPLIRAKKQMKAIGISESKYGSGTNSKFMNELIKMKINPASYLSVVRKVAEKEGYNSNSIYFSDKPEKKLMIKHNDKKVYFGQTGYGDFIIWNFLENMKVVPDGFASKKRKLYLARATKIKGDWEDDDYSPNNLAIRILW